ncbi:ubiquitinyl hydrolase 1 [Malassezia sp. CBS 17886]|nr:ubiquitinyl hydrolase 1 [Malassezia sp. CBS 17886]
MATIPVKYDVVLDSAGSGLAFKEAIALCTQVPPDRQKVMIKGGLLKDDTDLSKIGARAGQQFLVLGAAGALPKAPETPVMFLEDMKGDALTKAVRAREEPRRHGVTNRQADLRVGLTNLGNTCYLNSTLQVLRTVPELQDALNVYSGGVGAGDGDVGLTASLRDLYRDMGRSQEAFPPLVFLSMLRKIAPQFAETGEGGGYAQQDAEEAWVRILNALGTHLPAKQGADRFVQQYMRGVMATERSCVDAPQEGVSTTTEPFLMLHCNISSSTNEMTAGILDSLTQKIEKQSSELGRTATYDEKSRIARLPSYLTVHFVRFYWRRDIGKKTKIMRKVKFPLALDATPFATDELAEKLKPVGQKIMAVEKEREERAKVRQRTKQPAGASAPASDDAQPPPTAGAAITDDDERGLRVKERDEVQAAVSPELRDDRGCSVSGLYELVGIVTHKGAAADAGHYISWVRKEGSRDALAAPSDEWYKFDDDRVSIVNADKVRALDGGGEVLYRSRTL